MPGWQPWSVSYRELPLVGTTNSSIAGKTTEGDMVPAQGSVPTNKRQFGKWSALPLIPDSMTKPKYKPLLQQ